MRRIDADKLRKDILDLPNCYNGFSDTYDKAMIIDLIDEQPTVDAEPVRHGHWTAERLVSTGGFGGYLVKRCSVCGSGATDAFGNKWKYCPFCGAKMDEVEDE